MGVAKDSEDPISDEEFLEDCYRYGLFPTIGQLSDGRPWFHIYVQSAAPAWRLRQHPYVEPMLFLEFVHSELTDNGEPRFRLVRSKSDVRFHRVAYTPEGLAERRRYYALGWGPVAMRNERRRIRAKLRRAGVPLRWMRRMGG